MLKIVFDRKSYLELKNIDWIPTGNIVEFNDEKNEIVIKDQELFEAYLTYLSAEKGMDNDGNINEYGIKIEKLYDEYLKADITDKQIMIVKNILASIKTISRKAKIDYKQFCEDIFQYCKLINLPIESNLKV